MLSAGSTIVVDANLAVWAIVPVVAPVDAIGLLAGWHRQGLRLVAPPRWLAENVSAVRRSVYAGALSEEEGRTATASTWRWRRTSELSSGPATGGWRMAHGRRGPDGCTPCEVRVTTSAPVLKRQAARAASCAASPAPAAARPDIRLSSPSPGRPAEGVSAAPTWDSRRAAPPRCGGVGRPSRAAVQHPSRADGHGQARARGLAVSGSGGQPL